MMRPKSGWIALSLASACILGSACSRAPVKATDTCSPAREYVTTLEYLRDTKSISIPETEAREIASRVSEGCSGSARRFIRVTEILSRAGLGAKDMLRTSTDLALRTDRESDTFLAVFVRAFSPDQMDLDLGASIRMARSLSTEFRGDIENVRKDFERVLDYCVSTKELDLPRRQCGELAARVARLGEKHAGGVAGGFIQGLEFARSPKGPGLSIKPALELAETLASEGPRAPENFQQAYRYAVSGSGLKLGGDQAVKFAKKIASRSVERESNQESAQPASKSK